MSRYGRKFEKVVKTGFSKSKKTNEILNSVIVHNVTTGIQFATNTNSTTRGYINTILYYSTLSNCCR